MVKNIITSENYTLSPLIIDINVAVNPLLVFYFKKTHNLVLHLPKYIVCGLNIYTCTGHSFSLRWAVNTEWTLLSTHALWTPAYTYVCVSTVTAAVSLFKVNYVKRFVATEADGVCLHYTVTKNLKQTSAFFLFLISSQSLLEVSSSASHC